MTTHPFITGERASQRHADRAADAQRQRLVRVSRGRSFRPKPLLGQDWARVTGSGHVPETDVEEGEYIEQRADALVDSRLARRA